MSFITAILGAISSISTILKFISAIKAAIGEAEFNSWIAEVETNTEKWKAAKTAEEKSSVAQAMVKLIGRHPTA